MTEIFRNETEKMESAIHWTEDQTKAIAYDEKTNLVLSAGAGSGKTAVLSQRLARRLLAEKIKPSEILVLTFTDKAAQNMRERVARTLEKDLRASSHPSRPFYKWQNALHQAQISTIHAFCLQLIRRFYYKIPGMGQNPRVLDGQIQTTLLQEALDEVLAGEYQELENHRKEKGENLKKGSYLDYLYQAHQVYNGAYNNEGLRENVLQILDYMRSFPFYRKQILQLFADQYAEALRFETSPTCRYFVDLARETWRKAYEAGEILRDHPWLLSQEKKKPSQEARQVRALLDFTKAHEGDFQRAFAGSPELCWTILHQVFEEGWPPLTSLRAGGRAKNAEEKDDFRSIWEEDFLPFAQLCTGGLRPTQTAYGRIQGERYPGVFQNSLEELKKNLKYSLRIAFVLLKLALKTDLTYDRLKRKGNFLDYGDFEHLSLEILQDTHVRSDVKDQYREIYLDEYQDTNDVQEAILASISKDNVFLVGDVKQSIYRFRDANPRLMLSKMATEPTIYLRENFRSEPGLVAVINHIFSYLMTKESAELAYDATQELRAGKVSTMVDNELLAPLFHVFTWKEEDGEREAEDEAEMEEGAFSHSASLNSPLPTPILDLVASNPEETLGANIILQERAKGRKWEDMVILARTHDSLKAYAEVLSAWKIPHVISDEIQTFDSKEMRSIAALLQALDNANQDLPLAALLAGPFLTDRLSYSELMQIRLFGNALQKKLEQEEGALGILGDKGLGQETFGQEALEEAEGTGGGRLAPWPFYQCVQAYRAYWAKLKADPTTDAVSLDPTSSGTVSFDTHSNDPDAFDPDSFDPNAFDLALAAKLTAIWEEFTALRQEATRRPFTEVLFKILNRDSYLHQLREDRFAADRLDEVDRVKDLALAYQENGGNLHGFTQYLTKIIENPPRLKKTNLEGKPAAVSLMTIHASKGLEFPLVLLAGAGKRFNLKQSERLFTLTKEEALVPMLYVPEENRAIQSPVNYLALKRHEEASLAEELRLLYVALTRASEEVYVLGKAPSSQEEERQAPYLDSADAYSKLPKNEIDGLRSELFLVQLGLGTHAKTNIPSLAKLFEEKSLTVTEIEGNANRIWPSWQGENAKDKRVGESDKSVIDRTLSLGETSTPGLSQVSTPGLSQASTSGLSQTSAPGLSQTSAPGLSQASLTKPAPAGPIHQATSLERSPAKLSVTGLNHLGPAVKAELWAQWTQVSPNRAPWDLSASPGTLELPYGGESSDIDLLGEEGVSTAEMPILLSPYRWEEKETKRRGAEYGSLIHLLLQKIPGEWVAKPFHQEASPYDDSFSHDEACSYDKSSSRSESSSKNDHQNGYDQYLALLDVFAKHCVILPEELPAAQDQKTYAMLEGFYASSWGQRVLAAERKKKLWREQSFTLALPAPGLDPALGKKTLVQGIIDLLFEENGKLYVIDFKTDAQGTEEVLMDRYSFQLRMYALAAAKIRRLPVDRCLIWQLRKNCSFELSLLS